MSNEPRFPDVTVQLPNDTNTGSRYVARVSGALRRGGATQEEVDEFIHEATSGDYDNMLATVQRWVDVA